MRCVTLVINIIITRIKSTQHSIAWSGCSGGSRSLLRMGRGGAEGAGKKVKWTVALNFPKESVGELCTLINFSEIQPPSRNH